MLSVSSGVAGLGAISIVMFLEMGYVAGVVMGLSWGCHGVVMEIGRASCRERV